MKKTPILLFVLLHLILLMACENIFSRNDKTVDSPSDILNGPSKQKVELRFTWWGGEERHNRTLRAIELFEERHPHIKIDPSYGNFEGYFENLTTQFNAGNTPDIIQFGGNLNDYVYRGVVLPLDTFIGNELDITLHDQSMIDAATFDGQFYGVSLGINTWGLLLNKSMFEEAGIPLPHITWTWEDFIEISIQLSDSLEGVYGTEYFDHNGFGIFIDQRGKTLHENGILGITYDDVVDWFQLWSDLREKGGALPADLQVTSTLTPEQSLFVRGKVAMTLIPSNLVEAYSNYSEDEVIFHPHPNNEIGRSGVSLRPSQFLAGNKYTRYPNEVALFLDFIVNDKEAATILGNERGTPVNSEIREFLLTNSSEMEREIFKFIDWVSITSDAPYVPNLPGYNETSALFLRISEEIAFGKKTVEDGAREYWNELEKVLTQYNK
ncbi:multiple sugar transport system substrate-binding protein [Evansella vedderi]|uniref:Multiple sugar transport system substrate-binding protein n=1 Tax=Evansella vedderi TaxID=38282 RepID=A0ABT9ZPM3_9BACI|nr:extracellular solute-binding protein [Evansella vedderi]MDQ0253187.1 multiple sugar transport system substrate-binding protein [Evansella vedderi]